MGKEEYVIKKLSNKIAELEKQLAEVEFLFLSASEKLQKQDEEIEKLKKHESEEEEHE